MESQSCRSALMSLNKPTTKSIVRIQGQRVDTMRGASLISGQLPHLANPLPLTMEHGVDNQANPPPGYMELTNINDYVEQE